MFSLNDLETVINKHNIGKGFDLVRSLHLHHGKFSFRISICKFVNKVNSHTYITPALLEGPKRVTVKSIFGSQTGSQIYRPVMTSTYFLKILEYFILPHLYKKLKLRQKQLPYRTATGLS